MNIVKNAIIKQGAVYGRPRVIGGPDGLLANLVPFDSNGAMWARRYDGKQSVERLGQYPDNFSSFMERRYNEDSLSNAFVELGPLYVVYSYNTPISWVTGFGDTITPDHRYSTTTKHHQNMCAAWIGEAICGCCGLQMKECAMITVGTGQNWV